MKIAFLLFLFVFSSSYAQLPREKLEAIFIFKFIPFITWPTNIVGDFNICVDGDDKLLKELSINLSGKKIRDEIINIRRSSREDKDQKCSIFITGANSISTYSKNCKQCLYITKREDLFLHSMIHLKIVDNRINFDINYKYAKDRKFKISSKLLKIANRVLR